MKGRKIYEYKSGSLRFGVLTPNECDIPRATERKTSGKEYVSWGERNNFPQYLEQLYKDSAILGSVINGTANYALGDAIITDNSLGEFPDMANKDYESLRDVIKKLILDYVTFGGFAIDIIRNRLGAITELYHISIPNIRLSEDGERIYVSENWNDRNAEVTKYEAYDRNKVQLHSIYYFPGHRTRGIYPIPTYIGALPAIQTSIEIAKFHLSSILNNFTPSAIISFNNGDVTNEEAEDNERKLQEKFCGTANAGRILTTYSNSKENAPEVTRLESDNFDQKFGALRDSTMQEIFVAFSATPNLFGLPTATTGFSKQEFIEAFVLFQHNMLSELQNDIERALSVVFGVKNAVKFVPLNLFKEVNSTEE